MRIDLHRSAPLLRTETDSAKPAASATPGLTRSPYFLEKLAAGFLELVLTVMWCAMYAGLLLAAWGVAILVFGGLWKLVEVFTR